MKIIIFDVAAESSGALSILNMYYERAIKDIENDYVFVLSNSIFSPQPNIEIMQFSWIKKSWFFRLYFDYFIAPKIVKKIKADKVISLQNIIIPRVKVFQTVYMHQSLPFIEKRFKFKENRLLWVYQNIIGKMIIKSLKKADEIIVQTKWIKTACQKAAKIPAEKIILQMPPLDLDIKKRYIQTNSTKKTFFYPATALFYKNHKIIIEAALLLKQEGINDYSIYLTVTGDENEEIRLIKEKSRQNELPINFLGSIKREEVFEWYSKSVLLFPSYVESCGLPLLEARNHGTPVIAADTLFSREILDEYSNNFFDYDDAKKLSEIMKTFIQD